MTKLKGIFFDLDGVIIESERDGHRVAFNKTFKEFGFPIEWSTSEYQELLKITGGKERMKHYFKTRDFDVKKDEINDLIIKMHEYKTKEFIRIIEEGDISLRSGVKRIINEAKEKDFTIGICTTSNKKSAYAVVNNLLKGTDFDFILAGDMVVHKKPNPEIYCYALELTKLEKGQCIVIEDSRNGLLAAKAADLRVIITTSFYTKAEDFSEADLVISSFGDYHVEDCDIISSKKQIAIDKILQLKNIIDYF